MAQQPRNFTIWQANQALRQGCSRLRHESGYNEFLIPLAAMSGGASGVRMAYVIAEPCIGTKDAACIDACPVDCIHPKKDEPGFAEHNMIYIDPVECIDCGACVPVCPVSAIFALDDLPEKWSEFAQKNSEYFGR
jgi:NAD-dependent dihydropyrimidine dehydrogenase PreA subunit